MSLCVCSGTGQYTGLCGLEGVTENVNNCTCMAGERRSDRQVHSGWHTLLGAEAST